MKATGFAAVLGLWISLSLGGATAWAQVDTKEMMSPPMMRELPRLIAEPTASAADEPRLTRVLRGLYSEYAAAHADAERAVAGRKTERDRVRAFRDLSSRLERQRHLLAEFSERTKSQELRGDAERIEAARRALAYEVELNLATLYGVRGSYRQALDAVDRVLMDHPNDPRATRDRAWLVLAQASAGRRY